MQLTKDKYNLSRDNYNVSKMTTPLKPANNAPKELNSIYQQSRFSLAFNGYMPVLAKTISFGSDFERSIQSLKNIKKYEKIEPDKYQLEAMRHLHEGKNVTLEAPTGTGKTLVAEKLIKQNYDQGLKTYYTTPLKALTNQKYFDFLDNYSQLCGKYGADNVGIMTGDIKIKPEAKIIVATTEIINNMLSPADSEQNEKDFANVGGVIVDELQYMSDENRGTVWEELLIKLPDHVQILSTSATIGNAAEITEWIGQTHPGRESVLVSVPTEERHVPLNYYVFNNDQKSEDAFTPLLSSKVDLNYLEKKYERGELSERTQKALADFAKRISGNKTSTSIDGLNILKTDIFGVSSNIKIAKKDQNSTMSAEDLKLLLREKFGFSDDEVHEYVPLFEKKSSIQKNKTIKGIYNKKPRDEKSYMRNLINALAEEKNVPAIIFKFNRKGCEELADYCADNGKDLLSRNEKVLLQAEIAKYKKQNKIEDKFFNEERLLKGYAAHHSGLMPETKKFVEEMFQKKLLKAVFGTSTLEAGINMPAKTVVFAELDKMGDMLKVNAFLQMAGRAGRRGIDTAGYVILPKFRDDIEHVLKLLKLPADKIESHYRPSYQTALNFLKVNNDSAILKKMAEKSFLARSIPPELIGNQFDAYIGILNKYKLIEQLDDENKYTVTPHGRVASAMQGLNPLLFSKWIQDERVAELSPAALAGFFSQFATDESSTGIPKINIDEARVYDKYEEIGNLLPALGISAIIKPDEKGIINEESLKSVKEAILAKFDEMGIDQNTTLEVERWEVSKALNTITSMSSMGILKEQPSEKDVISDFDFDQPIDNKTLNIYQHLLLNERMRQLSNEKNQALSGINVEELNTNRSNLKKLSFELFNEILNHNSLGNAGTYTITNKDDIKRQSIKTQKAFRIVNQQYFEEAVNKALEDKKTNPMTLEKIQECLELKDSPSGNSPKYHELTYAIKRELNVPIYNYKKDAKSLANKLKTKKILSDQEQTFLEEFQKLSKFKNQNIHGQKPVSIDNHTNLNNLNKVENDLLKSMQKYKNTKIKLNTLEIDVNKLENRLKSLTNKLIAKNLEEKLQSTLSTLMQKSNKRYEDKLLIQQIELWQSLNKKKNSGGKLNKNDRKVFDTMTANFQKTYKQPTNRHNIIKELQGTHSTDPDFIAIINEQNVLKTSKENYNLCKEELKTSEKEGNDILNTLLKTGALNKKLHKLSQTLAAEPVKNTTLIAKIESWKKLEQTPLSLSERFKLLNQALTKRYNGPGILEKKLKSELNQLKQANNPENNALIKNIEDWQKLHKAKQMNSAIKSLKSKDAKLEKTFAELQDEYPEYPNFSERKIPAAVIKKHIEIETEFLQQRSQEIRELREEASKLIRANDIIKSFEFLIRNRKSLMKIQEDKTSLQKLTDEIKKDVRSISKDQEESGIENNDIEFNPLLRNILIDWINADDENTPDAWQSCLNDFRSAQKRSMSGDLYRVMNRTLSILKQAEQLCERETGLDNKPVWKKLGENLGIAIKKLNRAPIGTIGELKIH